MGLIPQTQAQRDRWKPNVLSTGGTRTEAIVTHGEKEFGHQTEGVIIRDTFFNKTLTKWLVQRHYGYDKPMLDAANAAILANVERMIAVQMSVDDLSNSMADLGIQDFDMSGYAQLVDRVSSMIALRTYDDLISAIGLDRYRDEIMLREVENLFGSARRLAAAERKDKDEKSRVAASQHNILERMMTALEEMRDQTKTDMKNKGKRGAERAPMKSNSMVNNLRALTQEMRRSLEGNMNGNQAEAEN